MQRAFDFALLPVQIRRRAALEHVFLSPTVRELALHRSLVQPAAVFRSGIAAGKPRRS